MHTVDATYTSILSGAHRAEWKVAIAGVDVGEDELESIEITSAVFGNAPTLGSCISAEIEIKLKKPSFDIPRMAQIIPYIRIRNESQISMWLQKGVFYIDTREVTKNDGIERMTIHGYDAMLMAEQDAPLDGFPKSDIATVNQIANQLGVTCDSSVASSILGSYTIQMPSEYSSREVLGYIAAAYGGCFIMDDEGYLRFVKLNGFPPETNLLINAAGLRIVFGGDRIIV